jgi:hypothetical protein
MNNGVQSPTYNYQRGAIKSLVQKAMLTSDANVGNGLIPQHLEKLISNTIVRLVPEIAIIDPQFDSQKYHEFNRLTALPGGQGAIGESGVTPTNRSTYIRTGRNLKVTRRKGAVTNFLQDASKNYIDALSIEMENHVQAHAYDMAVQLLNGNDQADPYTFPGWDYFIATNRKPGTRGGTVPTDLSLLDDMIDANIRRQGANHRRVFMMSPELLSKYSRLLTNVRLNQGLSQGGLSTVEIPGGWRLQAYRDIPIVTTTQTRNDTQMGTITPSTATSGGTVAAATYYVQVAYIDINGESVASAEVSQVTTGATSTLTLAWADVASAWYYRIYISTSTGTETLIAVLPANQYDTTGTPTARTTTVTFSSPLTAVNPTVSAPSGLVSTLPASYAPVTTAMASDLPVVQQGGITPEKIYFIDLDKIQGLGKFAYTNSAGARFGGLVTMEPLAKTDDNNPFMIKTYGTLIDSWEATSYMAANIRRA